MAEVQQPPFSAEALNRYRMTHGDRDIRQVIRRLNAAGTVVEGQQPEEGEAELLHLEVEKWRLNVERMMASTRSMERQKREYERKRDDTEALRAKLAEETLLLRAKQTEKARRMKCDEVARKITARGKTRKDLDAQIASLQALIVDHRGSYEAVLGVAQQRADTFGRIAALVDECRGLKLPLSEEDAAAEKLVEQAEKELRAEKAAEKAEKTRLSAQTLPFQPSAKPALASKPALSAPASRQHSASPGPSGHAHGSHPLPARPVRSGSRRGTVAPAHPAHAGSGLPPRPVSGLRNVRHMHSSGPGGLEDGELGEDDGSAGTKRKAPAEEPSHGRSTRRK